MKNAPVDPGRFFSPTERRWCTMRPARLKVAVQIDYRFVLAIALSLAVLAGIVLLLKK